MASLLTLVVLVAPASLLFAALMSVRYPGLRPHPLAKIATAASGAGLGIALLALLWVALAGTQATPLWGMAELGFSLRLDTLSAVIFSMVALLAVVILRYSRTYLDGDERQGVFLGRLCLTIASVQVLVLAGNLLLFAAAWIATSLSLHQLLVFYHERRRAVIAARKKFIVARIGDVSLLAASALLYARFGTGDLGVIFAKAGAQSPDVSLHMATVLIAIAALFKSAQFPTHGWLVEVMETPTPVSALLHAGILNAGPYLVMRLAPIMELGSFSSALLVLVGGFTALFASLVLVTQPTVKVALGYSSAAHMGFTLFVCGLGVYSAAILHMVAHSFYKAHAFLSSGSIVEVARASHIAIPERLHNPKRILLSLGVAVLSYAAVATLLGIDPTDAPGLLLVGGVIVLGLTQLFAGALDARISAMAGARIATLAALVTLSFFVLEESARLVLATALPPLAAPPAIVTVVAVSVLLAFAATTALQLSGLHSRTPWRHAAYVHVRNGFYANALFDRLVGAWRR